MEDNNQIKSTSITDIKDFIVNNSYLNMSIEICGLLGFNKETEEYIAKIEKNQSPDPKNYFLMDTVNYLNFKNKYSLIGLFHSHVISDEKPSEFDIKMSEAACLPFIIYSINSKNFSVYEPINKDYEQYLLEKIKLKFC